MKNKINICLLFILFVFGLVFGAEMIFSAHITAKVFANSYDENTTLPNAYCLRDDYFIQTTNQQGQGLCWDFASSMAFTTTVMHATNQYIDFSEGWVSNYLSTTNRNYEPGEGGSFSGYSNAVKDAGVILEQDFNYEDSFQITKENTQDFYEYYKDYADTTIVKNYKTTYINYNRNGEEEDFEDFKMQVKHHIMSQGALYVAFGWTTSSCIINSQTIIYKNPTGQSGSSHALAIIGWDDDIIINHEGSLYKGAWIFINSWGNRSGNQEGIFYLLYDDASANYLSGFEYVEEKDDLYFFNKLENSSASFISDKRNAYTGNFQKETFETKQKNIFYNTNSVKLEYSYEISQDTELKSVKILKNQCDITEKFDIKIQNNLVNIKSLENLDIGAYSIKFTYENLTDSEWTYGAFYILNGTETEYIEVICGTRMNINKNTYLQCVCPMQNGYDHILIGTEYDYAYILLNINFATYSNVLKAYVKNPLTNQVLVQSNLYSTPQSDFMLSCNYNLTEYMNYELHIIGQNATKILNINFVRINTDESAFVRMNYNVDNGDINNKKTIAISHDEPTKINNPTKNGYEFVGWYYSKDFTNESILLCKDGHFYLEYDRVIHYNDCTSYWSESIKPYINYNFYSFIVYAKWVKLDEGKTYHTIISNVEGNGYVSERGYVYIEEHTSKTFDLDIQGYDIEYLIIDGVIANNQDIYEYCQNGIIFEDVCDNHILSIKFIPRTDTIYKVYHYKQSLNETEFLFNDKYYDEPIVETFTGTTDSFTNVLAYEYEHFFNKDFSQQKISKNGSTKICIYYDRELFEVLITFNGIRYDSTKYDICDSLIFDSTKTYDICPTGYRVTKCQINNEDFAYNDYFTIENIECDYEIIVDVEEKLHDITYNINQNGKIYCNDSTENIFDGELRCFTIVVDDGYAVKNLFVNGQQIEIQNGYFTLVIDDDIEIKADIINLKEIFILTQILILAFSIISFVIYFIIKIHINKKRNKNKTRFVRYRINLNK